MAHDNITTAVCSVFPHRTFPLLLQWEMSAATPGVLTMSNKDRCSIFPDSLRRRDMGCPMPPAAPTTVTWLL